jgi:hypothetical protein
MATRYVYTNGTKTLDFPQYPADAWNFSMGGPDELVDEAFYSRVSAVFRAINLTASATAHIPFALVTARGTEYDTSDKWKNKVGFMANPSELIRLWRMSLSMTNAAYGFMEVTKGVKTLRYIAPHTMTPNVTVDGLKSFKRTLGTRTTDYPVGRGCPITWMWRLDHSTEILPAKATEYKAMMASAGVLYYSDHFIEEFFKRGGIKPTMLVLKGMTTRENIDKIENIWDKVVRGYYKYLGKVFQGVDAQGGLEAVTIGDGVDAFKDQELTQSAIANVAMSIGMPLSLLLSNSANYATAMVEYKGWYENSLAPWCEFMAEEMTQQLFKPLGLRFEFRPEMTDPGQEDEVARAGAYASYIGAGMLPSIAAQVVGIELPPGVEYESLDPEEEPEPEPQPEQLKPPAIAEEVEQSSTDDEDEPEDETPAKGWTPNIGQLRELDLWQQFAYRKMKRGETMAFGFVAKTIPGAVADRIRVSLADAVDMDGIRTAFEIREVKMTQPQTNEPDSIRVLAEAINLAATKGVAEGYQPAMKAIIDMPTINITIPEIRIPPANVTVNVPEQPATVVNVSVPEQMQPVVNVNVPAPVVNITNDVTTPAPVINLKPASLESTVIRDNMGVITKVRTNAN